MPLARTDQALQFEFALRTRIVHGPGVVDLLGRYAAELGAKRVFLVSDPGVAAAGHTERAARSLVKSGLEVLRYDDTPPSPRSRDVDVCREVLGEFAADLFVAVGGGSAIDLAKACNFVAAGGGRIEDYRGSNAARGELRPMIAVPTTAGTGSEMQSYALIQEDETGQKLACGDPRAVPVLALLDPELSITMPREVTATSGMDAIVHAVETAVSVTRTRASEMLSHRAFTELVEALPRVLEDPRDLTGRGRMLLAAAFAGAAIENSMLGAAHSMANPLTARFGTPHGQAVATALPVVVRFNAELDDIRSAYAELARCARIAPPGTSPHAAVDALIARLCDLNALVGFPVRLGQLGVGANDLETLAGDAAQQWTAQFNPRAVDRATFHDLYARLYAGDFG